MNPCPCGYYGHPKKRCTCLPGQVNKYMNKISGPLMDRIDLQVEIQPVAFDDMANTVPAESSEKIRERVIKARIIQTERFKGERGVYCNAQMNTRLLRKYAWPQADGLSKLKERMEKLNMSGRAFDRILRVARTIADLEYSQSLPSVNSSDYVSALSAGVTAPVLSHHIAEAIGYRSLDRSDYGTIF